MNNIFDNLGWLDFYHPAGMMVYCLLVLFCHYQQVAGEWGFNFITFVVENLFDTVNFVLFRLNGSRGMRIDHFK